MPVILPPEAFDDAVVKEGRSAMDRFNRRDFA
jgi:hypothetical protein